MSKIKNNVACLGDALLMDMYPGAKVVNKNEKVYLEDLDKIHLDGQFQGSYLAFWGPVSGQTIIDLRRQYGSASDLITKNIQSSEVLDQLSHIVIGYSTIENKKIYRFTNDLKTEVDNRWDWIEPTHQKSNWKLSIPQYIKHSSSTIVSSKIDLGKTFFTFVGILLIMSCIFLIIHVGIGAIGFVLTFGIYSIGNTWLDNRRKRNHQTIN